MTAIKLILSFVLVHWVVALSAQSYWLQSQYEVGRSMLQDRIHKDVAIETAASTTLNYHPTVQLSTPFSLPLTKHDFAQCQIFTVYQSHQADSEGLIWKMCANGKDQLLGTDQRMVDLSLGKYMNYIDHSPYEPEITSYQHYRSDFAADALILGSSPARPDIPVEGYQGALAEMIVFDRVLAPTTKQAIESYLALKYSIPLTKGMDYADLHGDPYWKYSNNKDYAHNVAGIGSYSKLGLEQKQSSSSFGSGTISLGLAKAYKYNAENPHQLADESYLVWSDDGGPIDFEVQNGNPAKLIRQWKVNTTGSVSEQRLFFQMKHAGLAHDLEAGLSYWLAWSADAKAMELDRCEHYQLQQTSDGFYADGIVAHPERQSYFSLLKAPDFFATISVTEVDCQSAVLGAISFKPIGGEAPYLVQVFDEHGQEVHSSNYTSSEATTISDLPFGKYQIALQDSKKQKYVSTFYLNGKVSAQIDLPSSIVLQEEELSFAPDIAHTESLDFLWTAPSGELTYGASIIFHESGTHVLQVSDGQCQAWYTTEVLRRQSNIEATHLSPNPTTDGNFTYEAILKKAAPYSLYITDVNGVEMYRQDCVAEKYITFQDRLPSPGTYLISLVTEGSTATDKLIVIR